MMKLFSYMLIAVLPLMCASPGSDTAALELVDSSTMPEEIAVNETNYNTQAKTITQEDVEQKIIKTAFLRFESTNMDKSYQQLLRSINANKGFVQDDNSSKSYNTITRTLKVRIPTTNFQSALDSISKHVTYFDSRSISAKDVTEEFIDIEARLKAKQELEKRYLELLDKAKTVKEILDIERELTNIREEIEAKQGRLKYLQNKVSLSNITLEFYKHTSETPVATNYGTKMWNALKGGFSGISIFFLGLLYIWPILVLLVVGIFIIKRWMKKQKK